MDQISTQNHSYKVPGEEFEAFLSFMNMGKSYMRGAHHVSGWGEINYKYVYMRGVL